MRYLVVFLMCSQIFPSKGVAQMQRFLYFVSFDAKDFNIPAENLPVNLQLREKRGILVDSLDYPVHQEYISELSKIRGVQCLYTLRWLNGAVVVLNDRGDSSLIKSLDYVLSLRYLGPQTHSEEKSRGVPVEPQSKVKAPDNLMDLPSPGLATTQLEQLGINELHKQGFTGTGVRIAVFDAGFFRVNELSTFKHLFDENALNGNVMAAYNIAEPERGVYDNDDHGMHVLSCMAAYNPGRMLGTAYSANYYLFRTEVASSEYVAEEYHWMRAAEMADSIGIDIINSSLGYAQFDDKETSYTHNDLNGQTSVIAQAASIAVQKGMLVVNAAGNEGNKQWRKIITPADAAEVISVGAVDLHRNAASFTSHGLTADGRIKPDVAALGASAAIASSYGSFYLSNGTSYATPILSGALACLFQKYGYLPPSRYKELLQSCGHQNTQADSLLGYGVPSFRAANHALKGKKIDIPDIMMISDTVQSAVDVAITWSNKFPLNVRLVKPERFLWFFTRYRSIYREKIPITEQGFVYRYIPLNTFFQKGYCLLIVEFKNDRKVKLEYSFNVK